MEAPPNAPAMPPPANPPVNLPRPVDVFFPPNFRSADKLKLFSSSDFIGYVSPADEELGITESDMTRKRILDWTTKFTAVHYESDHFVDNIRGGTLNDYVTDSSFDHVYIIGQNLPEESIGSLHFQAFVVNEAFLTRLHRKKQLYRGYIYMFLLSTSTEHWKTIIRDSNIGLEVPNVRLSGDGQMALRALESARTDQEATADHLLVARFDAIGMLDEYENPKEKLIEMSRIFALLKETSRAALYNVPWFGYKIVYSFLVHNDLYETPRTEIMNSMATFASHQAICDKVYRYYTCNKVFWPGFDEAATVLATKARGTFGAQKGASNSTLNCANCGLSGHIDANCRMKGGAKEEICAYCSRVSGKTIYGHGSAANPCFRKPNGRKKNDNRRSGDRTGNGGRSYAVTDKPPCRYPGCEAKSRRFHCTSECPTLIAKFKGGSSKIDGGKARGSAFAARKVVKKKQKRDLTKKNVAIAPKKTVRNVSFSGKANAAGKVKKASAVVRMSSDDEEDEDLE